MPDLLAQVLQARRRASPPACAVIDAELHVQERPRELAPCADQPWRRQVQVRADDESVPVPVADETTGGRIKRAGAGGFAEVGADLGLEQAVVLPGRLLGLHPQTSMEVALARASARRMVQAFLPASPAAAVMLCGGAGRHPGTQRRARPRTGPPPAARPGGDPG